MLTPYVQSLTLLHQQVESLPVCAAHTLGSKKIKALYEEIREVNEQDAPRWLGTNQMALERLSTQVNDYYTSRRITGPGYIYGIALPQPQSVLERVNQAASRILIQERVTMLENLAYGPEFQWLSKDPAKGEELLDELETICLEEAQRLVDRLNHHSNDLHLQMGFPDAQAFTQRFSIYAQNWVRAVHADFANHVNTMAEKDLALLKYVNPNGSDQRITEYYATLTANPSRYSVECFETMLERKYELAAWLTQRAAKIFGDVLAGDGQNLEPGAEIEETVFLTTAMEKLAQRLSHEVASLEKDDVFDRYLCHQVVHELIAPVKIKASTGDLFALFSKEMPSKRKVAAPHRSIFDLLEALKGSEAKPINGEEPFRLNLVGFEHRLENMDSLTARATVSLCYREWLSGISLALK